MNERDALCLSHVLDAVAEIEAYSISTSIEHQ